MAGFVHILHKIGGKQPSIF